MQEHRYQVDALVTERTTGVRGVVIERKWFVDLRPPVKPATPAYPCISQMAGARTY